MESKLPFGKKNYQLMIIGVVVLVLGFIIMSVDKEEFGFGLLGWVVGPVVVVAGFIIEIWAILHSPAEKK
jgi:isoprenylcysteine carboxyl methyltransferase (ICMT) family protein YpbQ